MEGLNCWVCRGSRVLPRGCRWVVEHGDRGKEYEVMDLVFKHTFEVISVGRLLPSNLSGAALSCIVHESFAGRAQPDCWLGVYMV